MATRTVLTLLVALLIACTAILRPARDSAAPPGEMNADGTINPCHGYERRHQECGNALWNARHINHVALGQSIEDVSALMRHEPERRESRIDERGRAVESWGFLTDYRGRLVTTITFTDGKVTEIRQVPWEEPRRRK